MDLRDDPRLETSTRKPKVGPMTPCRCSLGTSYGYFSLFLQRHGFSVLWRLLINDADNMADTE